MRLPWQKKVETRSYTAVITDALEAAVSSGDTGARSAAIAAVAQYLASELGGAEVEAPTGVRITGEWLDWMGRQAVMEGEAVSLIRTRRDGSIALLPVADHDWQHSPNPDEESWTCRATMYAPSGTETVIARRNQLVVLRYSWNSYSPGFGRGPSALAGNASKLATRSEARQADHGQTPVRPFLVIPAGKDPSSESFDGVRSDVSKGGGFPLIVETMAGGGGSRADAPQRDWQPTHLRPEPTAQLNEMTRDAFDRMVAAAGLPPALFRAGSDGTSLRESLRQGRMRFTEPFRRRLEDELREQVDDTIRLNLDNYPLDMVSRAQVVSKLTSAGVDIGVAMNAVGLADGG